MGVGRLVAAGRGRGAVRRHRYDRRRRHHSRHRQLFSRVLATSGLTHARCVNRTWGCCSLRRCTHHSCFADKLKRPVLCNRFGQASLKPARMLPTPSDEHTWRLTRSEEYMYGCAPLLAPCPFQVATGAGPPSQFLSPGHLRPDTSCDVERVADSALRRRSNSRRRSRPVFIAEMPKTHWKFSKRAYMRLIQATNSQGLRHLQRLGRWDSVRMLGLIVVLLRATQARKQRSLYGTRRP